MLHSRVEEDTQTGKVVLVAKDGAGDRTVASHPHGETITVE
jgi:hypothetical protein